MNLKEFLNKLNYFSSINSDAEKYDVKVLEDRGDRILVTRVQMDLETKEIIILKEF